MDEQSQKQCLDCISDHKLTRVIDGKQRLPVFFRTAPLPGIELTKTYEELQLQVDASTVCVY